MSWNLLAFGAAIALTGPATALAQVVSEAAPASTNPLGADAANTAAPSQASSTPATISDVLSGICTDRPTKSNYACTVDAGRFQYESDVVNASFLRLGGVTTDTYIIINPTLKYGLTSTLDIEANFAPVEISRTQGEGYPARTLEGVSDLYLRLKDEVLNVDGGKLQVAILPYVKAPTSRLGLGNGALEGGVIAPVNYKLSSILTLTIDPEVDFYKDASDQGRHVNTAQLVNLGLSLPMNVTLYGELWGDWNFDPSGVVRQYSADAAVAYGLTNALQLDAGLNVGLNKYTPGVQAYVGVSQKF